MTYKLAICDDNEADCRYIEKLVHDWAKEKSLSVRIDCFPTAEAFLFQYEEQKDYDILLLDIEMGQMDGVQLAKQIRKDNEAVQIVFITGFSEYIAEGYEVAALHYLMKPVNVDKLAQVLNRAVEKLAKNECVLFVEQAGEMLRIPFYEIRYLEVLKNYVTIHGKQDYIVKKTLGEFEKELDERFFRTGRSYIVNLSFVQRVTKTEVWLTDGTMIPLSRGMYEAVNRAIISRM